MAITISSPSSYQIYQRDSGGFANIPITGTYTGSPTSIEASFAGDAFETIVASPAGGTYSGTLTLQSQGQGTLVVRFGNDHAQSASTANVCIGDVFLVAGQSNAAGHGDNNQSYTPAFGIQACMFKRGTSSWAELADPAGDEGGSPWLRLATLYLENQGVPVGFITTGVDGTSLVVDGDWEQGGPQYTNCLSQLTASGVNTVKAILWHQGEAEINAGIDQTTYEDALSLMLDNMQADSAKLAGVKLIAAQIGYKSTSGSTREEIDPIRFAIAELWQSDDDILAGPVLYDIDLSDGDGVHFGSGSDSELTTLGERWWRMLSYHYYHGSQGRAPHRVRATRDGTAITVTFGGGVTPLQGATSTTGWRVTDNGVAVTVISAVGSGSNRVIVTMGAEPVGLCKISLGSGNDGAGTLLRDSGTYPLPCEPFSDYTVLGVAGADFDSGYNADFAFYVDVEDSGGVKYGSGPLKALDWQTSSRFDRAGSFSCRFLATDPQASYVSSRRYLRAWALLNSVWTEVGFGRVDSLSTSPDDDGRVVIQASGLDVTTELADYNVGDLEIGRATDEALPIAGSTHAQALTTIGEVLDDVPNAPLWLLTPADAPANDYLYARFSGESVLGALVHLAERTQTHFYRGAGRELVFRSEFDASGIRAIQASGPLAAQTCAITQLSWTVDTHDYLSRITPYGAGQADARLTLRASNRTAPVGYTLNRTSNYIENDDATAEFGYKDHPQIEFKEITPIANTNADLRGAANMLFDAALAELRWRSSLSEQLTYTLAVSGCSILLHPLQTIRVIYWDPDQGIDVDEDLLILEATWEVNATGVSTSRLVVSTDDRWPDSDVSAAAERAVQGRVFIAHPQIGPTEWWSNLTLYVGSDQADHVDVFPFVLSARVVTVQQVVFRYTVESVLSFTTIVGASSTTSDSNIDDTSTGGSTHSHTVTISGHTHPVPNHQHATTVAGGGGGAALSLNTPGGGLGFLTKVAAGDVTLNTNVASGGTTATSGGSTATTSGDESTHTHGIEHTHEVTPQINQSYGLYRAPASQTYTLEELEMSINGWGTDGAGNWGPIDDVTYFWVNLADGIPVEAGYYEIDLSTACSDEEYDFRPRQADNLIEVRRTSGAGEVAIDSILGDGTTAIVVITPLEYADLGLDEGSGVTILGTTNFNGNYVISVNPANPTWFTISHSYSGSEAGGFFVLSKSAMVLSMLGVASTIQAITISA